MPAMASTRLIPEGEAGEGDQRWVGDADLKPEVERRRAESKTTWGILLLSYQCLGVIYGDIGTSPLYVYATAFATWTPKPDDVLGAFSIIFWTFTILVMLKYVSVVFYADDNGEGGTFAMYTLLSRHIGLTATGSMNSQDHKQLLAIQTPHASAAAAATAARRWWHSEVGPRLRRYFRQSPRLQLVLMIVVIFSVGLVLSDGVLTPTLSVMSAVGGLRQASSAITQTTVVGVSEGILIALFMVQSLGTHKVAALFAPIVALWLVANTGIGIFNIITYNPHVLKALNPYYAYLFFHNNGYTGWEALGGLMLCITGSEAMFADMGHFTRDSIKLSAWFFVYPALVITYAGQAAYLTKFPERIADTYWASIPHSIFYPMLVLATLAAIVASQALITGSFSIIRQAMSLGLFPKLEVVHTSDKHEGQIYIAEVNYALMLLCVAIVAGFQDGIALGNAYGVAVMAVMLCTTCLIALVELIVWEITPFIVVPSFALLFTIEMVYWSATLFKVPQGGWFTLAMAAVVAVIKLTWWAGGRLKRKCAKQGSSLQDTFNLARNSKGQKCLYLTACPKAPLSRPAGIGIYYTDSTSGTPAVMAHLATNMGSLQEVVILMTVRFLPLPYVQRGDCLLIRVLPNISNFYQVVARYGYQDRVDHGPEFVRYMVSQIARFVTTLNESTTDAAAGRAVLRNSVRRAFTLSHLPSAPLIQPPTRVTGGSAAALPVPCAAAAQVALEAADGGGGGGDPQSSSNSQPIPAWWSTPGVGSARRDTMRDDAQREDTSEYDGGDSQDGEEMAPAGVMLDSMMEDFDLENMAPPPPPRSTPTVAFSLSGMVRSATGVASSSNLDIAPSAMSFGSDMPVPSALSACGIVTISGGGGGGRVRGLSSLDGQAGRETPEVRVLLEAADRAVVFYVGKVGLHVGTTGSYVKKVFYNQFYGLLDRMSWRDWEAWAIPTNRMVAVDVVYKID